MTADELFDDGYDGYVSIAECAERMNLTVAQVWDLVERHVLRAYRYQGWGSVMVQPAIVRGWGS